MIRMVKEDGPGGVPLVILGLSHGNLDRLRDGHPIHLDIEQCGFLGLGRRQLIIYTGETEVEMMREVEHHGLVPEGSADQLEAEFAKQDEQQE